MARPNVPKFGNWENEDNVPYTVYFDKARKHKGGKMINPNDPQENPDMFSNIDPSAPASRPPKLRPRLDEPMGRGGVRPTPEHREGREDGDFRQFSNSPARGENTGHRTPNESSNGGRGQRPARAARPSTGPEQSFERSPLHPQYQAKIMGGGSGGSPAWQGRNHDSSHGTPGRSRLRPARGDESPDKSAAVPRFGEWDESDPQAAENFTGIFNKVREERNIGPGRASGTTPKHPTFVASTKPSSEPKKCCFPWW